MIKYKVGDDMNILICDDNIACAESLKKFVENYFAQKNIKAVITTMNDPIEAVNSDAAYEIAFLDIQMGDIDGFELAKILQERNRKVAVFFLTSFIKFQDDAMDNHAFRFYEKPFDPERLASGLDKALEYVGSTYINFRLRGSRETVTVPIDDIVYIERYNRETTVHTLSRDYDARDTIDHWCRTLGADNFFKVHRSCLVNMHYVTHCSYSELTLQDTTTVNIAARERKAFRNYWLNHA